MAANVAGFPDKSSILDADVFEKIGNEGSTM